MTCQIRRCGCIQCLPTELWRPLCLTQGECGKLAYGDGMWQAVRLIHFVVGITVEALQAEVELAPIYALR